MHAARWMGVTPWELLEHPAYWLELGILGMEAERKLNAARRKK